MKQRHLVSGEPFDGRAITCEADIVPIDTDLMSLRRRGRSRVLSRHPPPLRVRSKMGELSEAKKPVPILRPSHPASTGG